MIEESRIHCKEFKDAVERRRGGGMEQGRRSCEGLEWCCRGELGLRVIFEREIRGSKDPAIKLGRVRVRARSSPLKVRVRSGVRVRLVDTDVEDS